LNAAAKCNRFCHKTQEKFTAGSHNINNLINNRKYPAINVNITILRKPSFCLSALPKKQSLFYNSP